MKTGQTKSSGKLWSARKIAMEVLVKVEQDQAYSNLLLNQMLNLHQISKSDAGLTTELVYGTIQRLNTIDYFLNPFVSKGLNKLQPWVRSLLRLSFYQLYYLDRIPEHAIVHEAVNIAKSVGHQGISGMVNGVLRNLIRQLPLLKIPVDLNAVERISLLHSHPRWMVEMWLAQYGEQVTEQICVSNNQAPHVSIRVNLIKSSREAMLLRLREKDLTARPSELSASGIIVENGGNMALTEWYKNGDISIQDESSMLVAAIVDPKPGMMILDCCSAPGGKAMHMAEIMDDTGKIWANDIHEHKQQLIKAQATRLGLRCIDSMVCDALHLFERFADQSFDRILLDAPCSGLGVIRRKPDLKWTKTEEDVYSIAELQYTLIASVQRLLKPGGVLVYSTCTLLNEENQAVVKRFLKAYDTFQLEPNIKQFLAAEAQKLSMAESGMIQIMPQDYNTDGFFIARMIKR